jgi:hypothetical protein
MCGRRSDHGRNPSRRLSHSSSPSTTLSPPQGRAHVVGPASPIVRVVPLHALLIGIDHAVAAHVGRDEHSNRSMGSPTDRFVALERTRRFLCRAQRASRPRTRRVSAKPSLDVISTAGHSRVRLAYSRRGDFGVHERPISAPSLHRAGSASVRQASWLGIGALFSSSHGSPPPARRPVTTGSLGVGSLVAARSSQRAGRACPRWIDGPT